MKSYSEKLKDPRWQKVRLLVFERDGFTCRDCKSTDKPLHVHHCHYEKGSPWDTPEAYLMTLCADCHEGRQKLEAKAKRALGYVMSRMGHAEDDTQLRDFVSEMCKAEGFEFPTIVDEGALIDLWQKANK